MPTPRRESMHTPKGAYQKYANPDYVSRKALVKDLVPRVLRIALEARGITHDDAARLMGLSTAAFRDRLYGRTNLSIEEVIALAQTLDLDMSMLWNPNTTIGDLLAVKPTLSLGVAERSITQRNGFLRPRKDSANKAGTVHLHRRSIGGSEGHG